MSENYQLIQKISNGNKPYLIVFVVPSPTPDRATRNFVSQKLPDFYTAMAVVSASGLAKFIMNILFKLKPPSIPMKTFTNEPDAKEWIRSLKK